MKVRVIARRGFDFAHTDAYDIDPLDICQIERNLDEIIVFLVNGKELHTQKPIEFEAKYDVDTIVPH